MTAATGLYTGLRRNAASLTDAPSDRTTRAQDEGLPVEVRTDEAASAVGGGIVPPAQASAFVTVSRAGEVFPSAVDPALAPDGSRCPDDLPPGWRRSADGDRLSPREV